MGTNSHDAKNLPGKNEIALLLFGHMKIIRCKPH